MIVSDDDRARLEALVRDRKHSHKHVQRARIVLLSAAPINGQPRSRLVGSAFDPASVSVVVRPGKTRLHANTASLEKRKTPDSEPGTAPLLAIVERLDLTAWPLPAAEARPAALPPAPFESRWSWPAHQSQAPPAL